jgi:predicted aldo/keto reductase-like oxidoreductase
MLISNSLPQISNFTESTESDLPFYRKLGRTDLTVSCLGLGGGGGISSNDTLYAFDQGINYFFYSSDLHHYQYSNMTDALRKLCGRGSSVREKVVLATATYLKNPVAASTILFDQFQELGIDYTDIFFWGWIGPDDGQAIGKCLSFSPHIRGPNSIYQRQIEEAFGVSERLKKMGAVRYIGASFHDLSIAQQWLDSELIDVAMVRHNVAYRSAQTKVFNQLNADNPQRPGTVTFKSTYSFIVGSVSEAPPALPAKCWRPSVPDLYRYSLSQNCVDVCLTGLTKRWEIDAAISAMKQGKLTVEEIEYLSIYGDLYRNPEKIISIPPKKLIYRD